MKILISYKNDLLITTGEDKNLILFCLNNYQENNEKNISFYDEIFIKENYFNEQVILYLLF